MRLLVILATFGPLASFACNRRTDTAKFGNAICDFSEPTRRRIDCGIGGIDRAQCEIRGCCYDIKDVPHCFHKEIACFNYVRRRRYVGWKYITWYTVSLTSDSRQGITTAQKTGLEDDYEHEELRRRKRALSLYCPDVDYGAENVFRQILDDLTRQVGEGEGGITIVRLGDRANPVEASYLRTISGNRRRVEAIRAVIDPRHSSPNRIDFPRCFVAVMNNLDARNGDERFHLAASQYSGPPELYNMIPGEETRVNRNECG